MPGGKPIRSRKCKVCGASFTPARSIAPTCESFACRLEYANKAAQKSKERREKAERDADRARRESLKTRREWMAEAQSAFNAYIRERDKNKTCICCGKPLGEGSIGGGFDCGHYRSVGSAPHLRFDERNAHAQRKQCNRWGSGRAVDYRLGLIARIGICAVEELESDQSDRKYSIEDLKKIKTIYIEKRKSL